ncbi:MAG: hypothetical protein LBE37_00680, partial [Sphingobacterium sp.]|nr:hypothetical protein [Sphingobacterium sp.]
MAGEEKNPKVWPKEATEASDFDYLMVGNEDDPIMKIYKDKLNEVIVVQGESMPAVQGGATSATAVALVAGPTGQNRYFDASWGFWKYNNVVLKNPLGTDGIPQGNDGTLYWDGTALTWKISKMQELKAVEGVDVIDPDGVGVPKEKAVALYVEPIKQKIDYAIESDLEFSPTVTTGDAETRSYETREFTGWGGILGKPQDFDHINIAKIKWTQAGFPITEVNVTLRDTSYTGTILADKKVPFSGAINEVNDLLIDFPLITNADKKNIWYEVRTNGRLSRANALTVIGAKYSTATSIATRFSTSSGDVADGIGYFV